jgi:pilus assembly protein Flp/PilA
MDRYLERAEAMKSVQIFLLDESGSPAIEYGLVALLISLAGVTIFGSMGGKLQTIFGKIASNLFF